MADQLAPGTHAPVQGLVAGARLVGRYARRHPRPFILAVTGAAGFGMVTVGWSWALGHVVDRLIRPSFDGRSPNLFWPIALLVLAGAGRVSTARLRRFNAAIWQHRNAATWREQVVDQLLAQPASFFRRHSTGDLLAAADNDAETAVSVLAPLPYSLGVIVLLVSSIVWAATIDPVLGIALLTLLPILVLANSAFEKRVAGPTERVQAGVAKLSGTVHELVDGFGIVKGLGLERRMHTAAERDVRGLAAAKIESVRIRTIFETGQDLLPALATVSVILLGGWRVNEGAISVGQVVSVMALLNLIVWPLRLLGWALAELPRSLVASARLDALLGVGVPATPPHRDPVHPDAALELHGVGVVHDDGRTALEGVDLTLRRGTRVAVVGPTGSGKSTLLDVLAGLEAPSSGHRRIHAETTVVLVFQEPQVIAGTLRENVELGRQVTADDLSHAAATAEVDEFSGSLDRGLDTMIGERGVTLSGGQRQRLALARALARDPDVLLLDDTTSSLDAATEERVMARLGATRPDRTVVVVASRPSTIAFADEIVVLDGGRVADRGDHDALIVRSAVYQDLFNALAERADA